jgi:alpha-galactosidase
LNRTNVNVQELTVEAALTLKREHIYHAALLDPHTSSELTIDEIRNLVDDMIEGHGELLPTYH